MKKIMLCTLVICSGLVASSSLSPTSDQEASLETMAVLRDFDHVPNAQPSKRMVEGETELKLVKEMYSNLIILDSTVITLGRALDHQPKLTMLNLSNSNLPWSEYHNRTFCLVCPQLKEVYLNNALGKIPVLTFLREYCAADFLQSVVRSEGSCLFHIIDPDTKEEFSQKELQTMVRSVLAERASEKPRVKPWSELGLKYVCEFGSLCVEHGSFYAEAAFTNGIEFLKNRWKAGEGEEAILQDEQQRFQKESDSDDDCSFEEDG